MKSILFGAIRCLPLILFASPAPASLSPITFNKDIAPIIYRNCAPCHHANSSTPFDLITYDQVAKRSRQVVEVTRSHYMPPWPPEIGGGYPAFIGARHLGDDDIELIRRWVDGGIIEGAPSDLPPAPHWSGGWQLGPPDLIVEMPKTYRLPAEGKDLYRNFVIPSPVTEKRFVRAIEFRPESKAAHHVFIKTDRSRKSRMQDASEDSPGFPGIIAEGAVMPAGQFLTWQPGKTVSISPPGMPWILEPGTDLVLESHLRPTGRSEPIRFKIGLYFTNRAPERTAYRLVLTSLLIDIPPGATNFPVETSFQLPVDVEALAVLPHCHLLARRVEGEAAMPDGSRMPLLLIKNWDFNWQGDYRFQTPLKFPRGTVLRMQITYDNSTNNAKNPNVPPKRVRYGLQSTDEMAQLSFLLLPERVEDEKTLDVAYQRNAIQMMVRYDENAARENPNDADARLKLGKMRLAQRRTEEAKTEIERAIQLDPGLAQAHYFAGLIARLQKHLPDAAREFQIAATLSPTDGKVWGNLGLVRLDLGEAKSARECFQHALEIDPTDKISRAMLDQMPR